MSILAIGSTVQSYRSPAITRRIYTSQVTPLSARTFGTWTLGSGVLWAVAAYRIDNPELYVLTLANFVISLWHWSSEWLWFGTTKFSVVWPSLAFEITTITWMLSVWGHYVK
jgi:Erg28 like protein